MLPERSTVPSAPSLNRIQSDAGPTTLASVTARRAKVGMAERTLGKTAESRDTHAGQTFRRSGLSLRSDHPGVWSGRWTKAEPARAARVVGNSAPGGPGVRNENSPGHRGA